MTDQRSAANEPLAVPDGAGIGRDSGESYAARTKPKTADPGTASGSAATGPAPVESLLDADDFAVIAEEQAREGGSALSPSGAARPAPFTPSRQDPAAATERRISVVAWIEISVDVEADEDADLLGTGIVKQAVQDAIGHTVDFVDFVDRWSWDD